MNHGPGFREPAVLELFFFFFVFFVPVVLFVLV